MKFVLEVDFGRMPADAEMGKELGRILRYWGGAAKDLELEPGQGQVIYDSAYREVGRWTITDATDPAT
jgi:hypothetical protein